MSNNYFSYIVSKDTNRYKTSFPKPKIGEFDKKNHAWWLIIVI